MVWHIFRKDLKLLWWMVAGAALINLIQRANLSSMGPLFRVSLSPQVVLSGMLGIVGLLSTGVLIVMVVQEDALPGLRQDWLVRPTSRSRRSIASPLIIPLGPLTRHKAFILKPPSAALPAVVSGH